MIANGDIISPEKAREVLRQTGADHPWRVDAQEGRYLKAVFTRVA